MQIHASSEIGLFQEFLVNRSADPVATGSLEDAVRAFRAYQREMAELQAQLQIGVEQCERGEVDAFDTEATKRRLRERLEQAGHKE